MTQTPVTTDVIMLTSASDTLQFNADSGQFVSLRRKSAPAYECLETKHPAPVFALQFLDDRQRFQELTSDHATSIAIHSEVVSETRTRLIMQFTALGGYDLDITATVEADINEPLTRWSLHLHNGAGLRVTGIEYPFVVLRYGLGEPDEQSGLVWPVGAGMLYRNPTPADIEPDSPNAWQMRPENTAVLHYPGFITAQFMAYYSESVGVYLAAEDPNGYIKLLKPVHRKSGVRLGLAHIGNWPENGERTLEYDVVLGSFVGDWYAAATLYRDWSGQQAWASKPLAQRDDVPDWLLESPPHLMVRIQGELDSGPADPNEAFLPYPKLLPLLENVSKRIDSPVVPVIMSWERGGPWVYPDCFPAVGADSLPEFTSQAREKGWRVGTFCNGTRWVIGHRWSGYNGLDYYDAHQAEQGICRKHDGTLWAETWDAAWRPSYTACLGADQTMQVAQNFVQQVIDYGIDWIQFLDQNVGASTFPCYSADHNHPDLPGRWMTSAMGDLTAFFRQKQIENKAATDGKRQLVFSVEGPANEYWLQQFQICDVRVVPPNHQAAHPWWNGFIPLYHFLFHEHILIQGGFGHGADPHHLAIRNAYNLVVGEIPGAVLQGDGQLLNKDNPGINWAPWDNPLGDNEESLAMLHSATALRRGPGKPYLVFGRMLAPADVTSATMEWRHDRLFHEVPAVFHAAWQGQDGRFAVVLANWTQQPQDVTIHDARLTDTVQVHVAAPAVTSGTQAVANGSLTLQLPPLSCTVVEAG
jgi:hypothetical protein